MSSFLQKMSQHVDNDLAVVTPQESLQIDGQGPARKTIILESPKALSIRWIELLLNQWCTSAGKTLIGTTLLLS
jgi:hypothetical protein